MVNPDAVRERFYRFYWISHYGYKFESHWRDFYEENVSLRPFWSIPWNKRYSFSLDECITLAVCTIFVLIRFYSVTTILANPEQRQQQMHLGSFATLAGGHPFHVEILCIIWTLAAITYQLLPLSFRLKDFGWIEILMFLHHHPRQNLGLDLKQRRQLTRQSFRIMLIINTMAIGLSLLASSSIFCQYATNYSIGHLILYGIPWTIMYGFITVVDTLAALKTNAYVLIITGLVRMKFHRIEQLTIKALRQHNRRNRREYFLGRMHLAYSYRRFTLLMQHNEILNRWWRSNFSLSILWRWIAMNFLAFVVLFYSMAPSFQTFFLTIFLDSVLFMFITFLKIGMVHIDMVRTGNRVRNTLVIQPRFHMIRTQMKTMIMMEEMQRPMKIGQDSIIGIVRHRHIIMCARDISIYFFLFTTLSIQFKLK